jgi:hypothetical protein
MPTPPSLRASIFSVWDIFYSLEAAYPGRGAAYNGAPQIRDRFKTNAFEDPGRFTALSLYAAPRSRVR